MQIKRFQKIVWDYYRKYGRDLAWRKFPQSLSGSKRAYYVVVSEIMLQQTQVERVGPKYEAFIKQFPTFKALASAERSDVLRAWQGLGYNRRALNLQKLAQVVTKKYEGKLPDTVEELDELPGVGKGTAGSLMAFVFNKPVSFIETNIRRVFIHHFPPVYLPSAAPEATREAGKLSQKKIHDNDILPLVGKTMDTKNPREWYYALMDYGSHLSKKVENPNRKSAHYSKQAKFEGSDRQLRGRLLKEFLAGRKVSVPILAKLWGEPPSRLGKILVSLRREGFLS